VSLNFLYNTAPSNPKIAWQELRKIYGHFSFFMPKSSFFHLINPENRVCQILQSHFVALQIVMDPITQQEVPKNRAARTRDESKQAGKWFKPLHKSVPAEWLPYYEWPMWVEKEVLEGRIVDGSVSIEGEVGDIVEETAPY
jgi:hypothetical protein